MGVPPGVPYARQAGLNAVTHLDTDGGKNICALLPGRYNCSHGIVGKNARRAQQHDGLQEAQRSMHEGRRASKCEPAGPLYRRFPRSGRRLPSIEDSPDRAGGDGL